MSGLALIAALRPNAGRFIRVAAGAAAFALLAAVPASAIEDHGACQRYAFNAVDLAKSDYIKACGFTGPRYTAGFTDHMGWCLQVPQTAIDLEQERRARDMFACIGCGYFAEETVKQFEAAGRGSCPSKLNGRAAHWQPLPSHADMTRYCIQVFGDQRFPEYRVNPAADRDVKARAADLSTCQ